MSFTPCPKPAPRERAPRTKLPAVSERHDGGKEWWEAQSKRVHESQGGVCAICGVKFHRLDACHIEPLGTKATRYDMAHPLNQLANLFGACRRDHEHFDRQSKPWRRMRGAEIKAALECPPGAGRQRTGGLAR